MISLKKLHAMSTAVSGERKVGGWVGGGRRKSSYICIQKRGNTIEKHRKSVSVLREGRRVGEGGSDAGVGGWSDRWKKYILKDSFSPSRCRKKREES